MEKIPSQEELRKEFSIRGAPKYLDKRELCWKPRILVIWTCIKGQVLKKNN
jgi:hypothetical protein